MSGWFIFFIILSLVWLTGVFVYGSITAFMNTMTASRDNAIMDFYRDIAITTVIALTPLGLTFRHYYL